MRAMLLRNTSVSASTLLGTVILKPTFVSAPLPETRKHYPLSGVCPSGCPGTTRIFTAGPCLQICIDYDF